MENLTHSLVGLAAAKAGLERLSPGATALCVVAANAPDADVVTTYWGRWVYLHHHRGITHSIVGAAALALLLPLLFYGVERAVARVRRRPHAFRLKGLLIASLVATATHPILDWTNNYGVRPFLPWSRKWYYGDLVFIVDPWLWLILGGACFLLTARGILRTAFWTLLGLILTAAIVLLPLQAGGPSIPLFMRVAWVASVLSLVVVCSLYRHKLDRRVALTSLSVVLLYWGALAFMHARAVNEASHLAGEFAAARGDTVKRLAAMPSLADPTLWRCVAETNRGATFLFNLELNGNPRPLSDVILYERAAGEEARAVAEASRDERARIFLDFARFPVTETRGDCLTGTFVQFADLRYTEPQRGARGSFSLEVPVECPPEVGERLKR